MGVLGCSSSRYSVRSICQRDSSVSKPQAANPCEWSPSCYLALLVVHWNSSQLSAWYITIIRPGRELWRFVQNEPARLMEPQNESSGIGLLITNSVGCGISLTLVIKYTHLVSITPGFPGYLGPVSLIDPGAQEIIFPYSAGMNTPGCEPIPNLPPPPPK